jgi:hypothetical protein
MHPFLSLILIQSFDHKWSIVKIEIIFLTETSFLLLINIKYSMQKKKNIQRLASIQENKNEVTEKTRSYYPKVLLYSSYYFRKLKVPFNFSLNFLLIINSCFSLFPSATFSLSFLLSVMSNHRSYSTNNVLFLP